MDLEQIRQERQGWLQWRNIAPLQVALSQLPLLKPQSIKLGDTVMLCFEHITETQEAQIRSVALQLKPWRKGPFRISQTLIDSEWQSQVKYNLLEPHFDLRDKVVGDIGCNNGYYLFRMLAQHPKRLIGFDPSPLYYSQFQFINHFLGSKIEFELLGVEHLDAYAEPFDLLFCLGVLYHRSDPVSTLKSLNRALVKGGELILDSFVLDGEEEICLTPRDRYSKIPNIYFVPTISALTNWCLRAGFEHVEVLAVMTTGAQEQRKTEWIDTQSLSDFLDPDDPTRTVEGYLAPKRAYLKAVKPLQKSSTSKKN
jgi:tRNA (mo5U34)-methyltransferase